MKKGFKKFLTVLLSAAMICSYSVTAFAAEGEGAEAESLLKDMNVSVFVTAQAEGAFLAAPQTLTVNGYEAEAAGYTDAVTNSVSALDVLVAEHKVIFGEEEFLAAPTDCLNISASGWATNVFGLTDSFGFLLNGKVPHDDVYTDWGYTGYMVNQAAVADGDTVDFYLLQDKSTYMDNAVSVEGESTVEAGKALELTFKGYAAMLVGCEKDENIAASTAPIAEHQLATVNMASGEVTPLAGVLTDEAGKATVTFAEAGEYVVTILSDVENEEYVIMPLYKVTVTEAAPEEPVVDGTELAVTNNYKRFKVADAVVKANEDGSYKLTFTMSSTSYDKAFAGTARAAANADEVIEASVADGASTFEMNLDSSQVNKDITVAFHSMKNEMWYNRTINVNVENATLTTDNSAMAPVADSAAEIPFTADGMESSLGMFQISGTQLVANEDGTVDVTVIAGNSNRSFPKIALISQDSTEAEKEAAAIVGTPVAGSTNNEYQYSFTIDADQIGQPIEISHYQNSKGTEEWHNWSTQHTVTVKSTPSLVDQLIAAIYVQVRTEYTDKLCTVAKACWDALSDEQKEAVEEGDYYGADTGDASLDNPRNDDNIGDKELLVVSFGTSFNANRAATIGAIENELEKAFPEYSVRRAFTAQIIINHIQSRDGEVIDNMTQALDRAVANGVKELVVQPTHLMHGAEYDEMCEELAKYSEQMTIKIAEPLLNSEADKEAVAIATLEAAAKDAGFASVEAAVESDKAFVFMGHGTSHDAKETYTQMQETYDALGYKNVFIGTVEGKPESTSLPEVKKAVEAAGYSKVILRPLMVVAGDHANNDMAADEEGSWYYAFVNGGDFEVEGADAPVNVGAGFGKDNVEKQIAGLGEIPAVQQIYVAHSDDIIGNAPVEKTVTPLTINKADGLMVSTKEANLIEENGKYFLEFTFGSDSIGKVCPTLASRIDESKVVEVVDRKFVIPVEALDTKFHLAMYSKKNQQYYNRDITVSLKDKNVYLEPTMISVEGFQGLTVEEGIAKAEETATPELCDALIEAIYVQARDENTDMYCAAAKACWDALSDEDKALVEECDYFGRPTGDASLDNPRNQDEIGDKELLVVSFGTSFNKSRVDTIGAIENELEKAFPEYSVRRAFTAQIIINHIQSRDGEVIDNMTQALDRAVANGVKELVVQPTHLMHGAEYDEMCEELAKYESKIDKIIIAEPLLSTDADKEAVAIATLEEAAKDAGFATLEEALASDKAFVFMGHGTSHDAKETYTQMQETYDALGYKNVFIGTVEGKPESTSLPEVKKAVEAAGYSKVILRPLMVVAGDHANNDMAADEKGSWYYAFVNGGDFEVEGADEPVNVGTGFGKDNVKNQIAGLGEIADVQKIYVAHTYCAVNGHTDVTDKAVAATCTKAGKTAGSHCSVCGVVIKAQETVKAKGHAYKTVVTPATTKAAGKKVTKCTRTNCGHVKSTVTIKKIGKITLAKTAYVYSTTAKKPAVTVKNSAGTKIAATNYTVKYTNNKNVGKAKVTITFKGNYKGTVTKSFKINPKGTSIKSLTKGTKSFTVKWNKQGTKMASTRITGYQVKYSTKKSMASAKKVTVKGYTKVSKTVKNLTAKKRYYVQVRTYKTVNGVKYYSAWSEKKYVTTK